MPRITNRSEKDDHDPHEEHYQKVSYNKSRLQNRLAADPSIEQILDFAEHSQREQMLQWEKTRRLYDSDFEQSARETENAQGKGNEEGGLLAKLFSLCYRRNILPSRRTTNIQRLQTWILLVAFFIVALTNNCYSPTTVTVSSFFGAEEQQGAETGLVPDPYERGRLRFWLCAVSGFSGPLMPSMCVSTIA